MINNGVNVRERMWKWGGIRLVASTPSEMFEKNRRKKTRKISRECRMKMECINRWPRCTVHTVLKEWIDRLTACNERYINILLNKRSTSLSLSLPLSLTRRFLLIRKSFFVSRFPFLVLLSAGYSRLYFVYTRHQATENARAARISLVHSDVWCRVDGMHAWVLLNVWWWGQAYRCKRFIYF